MHKPGILLIAIFLLFSLSCSKKSEPYVLIGKVSNIEIDSIGIQLPVEGNFFYRINIRKFPIDDNGNFEAIIQDEVKGFTMISFPKNNSSIRTWIEPGYRDTVIIDFEDYSKLQFSGDHADANELLNSFERVPYFHAFGGADEKYQKDSIAQRVYDQLMSKIEEEKSRINQLTLENKISESFAQAMNIEAEFHWKSTFSAATWRHYYFKEQLKRDSPFNEEWKKLYLKIFDNTDFNNPDYLVSNYYRTLAEDYLRMYPEISGKQASLDSTLTQDEKTRQWHQRQIDFIRENFESKNEELIWAHYLFNAALQKRFEKVLLESYEEMKTLYPNTPYDPILKEYIDPIRQYHTKIEEQMPDNILMIENAETYETWEEIVAPYKGELLYVDLWATWCGPCKEEFKYKDGLYEFIKNKPIKILYVSSDKDDQEKRWKEMVNFYGLEGVNMRISQDLNWKIWSMIHDESWSAIPRYLIVDQEGKMIVKDAARPSERQKLYDQLASYLD